MLKYFLSALLSLSLTAPAFAQSQGANGAIEGTVSDTSGGILPGVTVTVTNVDTGTERSLVTNEKGLYRVPLLPLGTYRVVAELQGFKRFEQSGITLSVGQSAVVNVTMSVGTVSETITVNADSPVIDTSRIDIGHTMSDLEVHNLPLVARNPYNFALVQPGVTGIENVEFGVPRLAANGAAMRINYQVDGNTNTEKDRAGLRLLPMSEVMIQEVKVVTTGFAPEFGQTMGMVYNAVTPSGTNTFKGEGSYLFRRDPFSAFPFFFGCTGIASTCGDAPAGSVLPATKVDTGTADVGGPIIKNRAFFYAGWEQTRRDLSSTSLVTITPANASAIGLAPQPAAVPNVQTGKFLIGKGDFQLNNANRATVRWLRFHNDAPYNSGGGLASLEWATNFLDAMDSVAGQLVSSLGSDKLNELQVRLRLPDDSRRAHGRAAVPLHVPVGRRLPGGQDRVEPARVLVDDADHRRSRIRDGHAPHQPVRPGRLADRAESEVPVRRTVRPLPVPVGSGECAADRDAELQHRQEQLRTARRRGLVDRREDRDARQHRSNVRPADSRRLRAGAAAQWIAEGTGVYVYAGIGRRAVVPQPGVDVGHPGGAIAVVGGSELRRRAYLADQRAGRALVRPGLHGLCRVHLRQRRQPPGRNRRESHPHRELTQ
jgi:hypothetical protein